LQRNSRPLLIMRKRPELTNKHKTSGEVVSQFNCGSPIHATRRAVGNTNQV
jgi:hypothetical protein